MEMWISALLCLLGAASGYEDKSIPQYLADNPGDYSILSGLITRAGLYSQLEKGPFTMFAPTNAAFNGLDNATLNDLKSHPDQLANVLKYHVIEEYVLIPMITQPEVKTTMEGQTVIISASGGSLLLNGVAQVDNFASNHDILLNNGAIQPINKVLFPPQLATLNIAQILLKEDDRFQDMFYAILLAELTNLLETGDYTLFAPIDSAFTVYKDNLLSIDSPNAIATYRAVMYYHIVPGGRKEDQLKDGESLFTLHGSSVNVTKGTGTMVNDANIIDADILATNGIVHAIDRLLIPSNINQIVNG